MEPHQIYPTEHIDPSLRQTLIDALRQPPEDTQARECGLACSPAFPAMQATLKDLRGRLQNTPSADDIAAAEADAVDARDEYHELHEAAQQAIRTARRAKAETERLEGVAKKGRMARASLFNNAVGPWTRWQLLMQDALEPQLTNLGFQRNGSQAFVDTACAPPVERPLPEVSPPELARLPGGRALRECPSCHQLGVEVGTSGGPDGLIHMRCRNAACGRCFSFEANVERRAAADW